MYEHCVNRSSVLAVVIWLMLQSAVTSAPVPDTDSTADDGPSGRLIFELGQNYSRPLLRLFGHALQTNEEKAGLLQERLCKLHPCTEWEAWTRCSAPGVGRYGMKTRTRICSNSDKLCSNDRVSNLPTDDSMVCEEFCPKTYDYSTGHCIMVFKTSKTQYEAQAACEEDNGHLVNIDTRAKSDAVHTVLVNQGVKSDTVWINGNKTTPTGTWQFTYGAVPDFDNWKSGEPTNVASELCKIESNSNREWYDFDCSYKRYFVCEVVKNRTNIIITKTSKLAIFFE